MERDYTIQFTCSDCGAVYAATRSQSVIERTFRLFCPGCAGVLHEGSGNYSLSELAVVLPSVRQSQTDSLVYREDRRRKART